MPFLDDHRRRVPPQNVYRSIVVCIRAPARAVPYIWAENPGNDFGGLSVAKNAKISKVRLHTESFRIQCGLLCCATAWPFFI